ncbi:MAG: 50S ribosomal protein L9 [Gammaproteobacteria bacterium]|nr:50S ribosomal protein L9 [Gammaproteobacteria bacterium]|tara:strand:- start:96 stop:542 length:447 start_codon:yes stop_codon:yes gene_type:complete
MQIILLEKIGNLGDLGDEISVKPGFARNFLLPKGKAVRATETNRQDFEARRNELEVVANEKLGEAKGRAEALEGSEITITVKSGEEGKLYGSVGTQDIVDALGNSGFEIEKKEVRMPDGPIRSIGEYELDIQLHSDISVPVRILVESE